LDVRVTDTDAKSYRKRAPAKVLESQEKERNESIWSHASNIVVTSPLLSAQWMVCLDVAEAKTFTKRLSAKLANKWEKSYSQVCGYVNTRLSIIAIVRATYLCMRGSRVPVHKISIRYPQWEDGAGLSLFEC
jgi:hypothetical protein